MIKTDSLSTIMAAESCTPTNNPKTQTISRCWIRRDRELPSYGSPVTREYQVTKDTLNEDIPTTGIYPPDDLKK
jgi:hypothetical protein